MKKVITLFLVVAILLFAGCGEGSKKSTSEGTAKALGSATEKVSTATDSTLSKEGQRIYAKCSSCHGEDGRKKALGKSAIIAGQSKVDLIKKMKAYKAGTRNENGMGNLKKDLMSSLSDAAIAKVATYISTLK